MKTGVAWKIDCSGGLSVVLVILGDVVLMRSGDEPWRVGSYASTDMAQSAAVTMTSSYERIRQGQVSDAVTFAMTDDDWFIARSEATPPKGFLDSLSTALPGAA